MAEDHSRYAFVAEWFDSNSELIRKFLIIFYDNDGSIEMHDMNNRRPFLKKSNGENISLHDFHINRVLTICSRQLLITGYGDLSTQRRMARKTQKTLAILSSNALVHLGSIIELIENNKLKISKAKMVLLSHYEVTQFREMHQSETHSKLETLLSKPVLIMELVGEMSIYRWKELMNGDYDNSASSHINIDMLQEECFGSTQEDEAKEDLNFMFPPSMFARKSLSKLVNSTCGIIKPHIVMKGQSGAVIREIQDAGYHISALEMFYLDHTSASEFYEVYCNVLPEYKSMIHELVSGPCIGLEVTHSSDSNGFEIVSKFREFVGPLDPVIGREIRPHSLRAKYGIDKVQNGLHCTDLPEDSQIELEYLFKCLSN